MTRLTYVLGVVLIGIGIASIAIGVPEIQLERGWTAVIAGSIVGSAGVIVFVMGAVLKHLEALRVAVVELSAPQQQSIEAPQLYEELVAPEQVFPDPVAQRPISTDRPGERVGADVEFRTRSRPEPEELDAFQQPALEPLATVSRDTEPAEAFAPPPALAPDLPPADAQSVRRRPNFLGGLLSRRPAEDEVPRASPPGGEPESQEAAADPYGSVPPLHASEASDYRLDPAGFDHDPFGQESLEDQQFRPTYAEHSSEETHPAEPAEPATHDVVHDTAPHGADLASADHHPLRPSIVGRYTAGSASYIMYSNGMIEVETETGVHQFSSMQDLKRFIENQEAARV